MFITDQEAHDRMQEISVQMIYAFRRYLLFALRIKKTIQQSAGNPLLWTC